MSSAPSGKRATVHDLARTAGVSLATIDRVLNRRPGVRQATIDKVEAAIASLGFQRDLSASLLARGRDLNMAFLIPGGANEFMDELADAVRQQMALTRPERIAISLSRPRPLDPADLAAALDALHPASCDCAVIVASQSPVLVEAVDAATRRGIAVLTLVSDLPGSARRHFVGIDNLAAGRTAAQLLGRFCAGGEIGILAGAMELADHRARLDGFRAVMAAEFPHLSLVGPLEGFDDPARTEALAARLLAQNQKLTGIYNLGAGNSGLRAALLAHVGPRPRVIVHELTPTSRRGLAEQSFDLVLDQNPAGEIRAAIAAARALVLGTPPASDSIGIGIFLRDNLG